jgi:hypothetical protein
MTCAALIAAGFLASSAMTARAAADDSSVQVSGLLSEAKTQAFQLKEDAGELWLFTQVPASASSAAQIPPQSHLDSIHKISSDVSTMTVQLAKLEAARKTAAPWQQTAIDQINPLVKDLVASTEAVVEYIDKNPSKIYAEDYKDYVEANADAAAQLATLISSYVDYGKTRDRLNHLSKKLGLPGTN